MQALPAPPFPGSLTLCLHSSGICAPNPTQPNQHPLPLLDPTHHPSLWKLNPAGTNNHNKLRQQKALCSFSVPHTHTQLTPHTHTHSPTHTHSHTLSALSHTCLALPLLLSLSLCPVTPVLLSCPAQPSPASPCLALPCPPRGPRARAVSLPQWPHDRPRVTVPYLTAHHHLAHLAHHTTLLETTRNYYLLPPLSLSLSALTGHWHATAHRRRAPLVSPCDIATCDALSIPEPRASSTARPSDPSRHPSNPVLGHFPIRNTPRIITRKGIDRTHSTRLTIPASATTTPTTSTTSTTSTTTTTTTSPATDLPTSRHRPRLPLHLPDRHLCVRGGRGDIRWHHEGGFSGLGRGEEKHRHALCAGVTGVYMKY